MEFEGTPEPPAAIEWTRARGFACRHDDGARRERPRSSGGTGRPPRRARLQLSPTYRSSMIQPLSKLSVLGLPRWAPPAALAVSLALAWLNFLYGTWAAVPGALNGGGSRVRGGAAGRDVLTATTRRQVGGPVRIGRAPSWGSSPRARRCSWRAVLAASALYVDADPVQGRLDTALSGGGQRRQPPAAGSVVGWNWWLLGVPTSTDIAQSFGAVAFVPMTIFGEPVGYHVLHAVVFLAIPVFVWWDVRQDDREAALVAGGFACLFTAGYFATSVTAATRTRSSARSAPALALVGSRAARLGRRWGGPVLLLASRSALYSHVAFASTPGSISCSKPCTTVTSRRSCGWWWPARSRSSCRCRYTGSRCDIRRTSASTTRSTIPGADRLALPSGPLLQRRDPGAPAPLVQRLPEPRERLAAGAAW